MIGAWFYREFRHHVAKKGYKLLQDDFKFIERCIRGLPEWQQRQACRRYCQEWELGAALGQNQGRFRANQFLLHGVVHGIVHGVSHGRVDA